MYIQHSRSTLDDRQKPSLNLGFRMLEKVRRGPINCGDTCQDVKKERKRLEQPGLTRKERCLAS